MIFLYSFRQTSVYNEVGLSKDGHINSLTNTDDEIEEKSSKCVNLRSSPGQAIEISIKEEDNMIIGNNELENNMPIS